MEADGVAAVDVRPAAMGKGEDKLFEKKLTKEEKKALAAQKKAERDAKKGKVKAPAAGDAADGADDEATAAPGDITSAQARVAGARNANAVIASSRGARDIKFEQFSLQIGGAEFVKDCNLELCQGSRYGLIGENGSGKSNILAAIAQRDIPLPEHVDVFLLHEEAPPTEQTAVEAVVGHVTAEVARLEALAMAIVEECGAEDERLAPMYERIDELDPSGSEPRARKILAGLGFADHLVPMDRQTRHMSGGWRMRVSLAKALFAAPSVLLLDEPTNHLDLEACVWLETHLARYSKCLLVVSHSVDFLNAVTTHTVRLAGKSLAYYGGNYDTYCRVVADEERVQLKAYEKQQADMEKLADFVRVNKANGVAASAKSKQKVLEKLQEDAISRPTLREPTLKFTFPSMSRLAPPVLPFDDVCFSYSGKPEEFLYEKISFGIDFDSRIALVGPNGCGKSTLLKLMAGDLSPTSGTINKHAHLQLGRYHQHSADMLDDAQSPLQFMRTMFPPAVVKRSEEVWRSYLAQFGFTTPQQTAPIGLLSDGQKSRLVFAVLAMKESGVLLLDEPTNHLDVDAVDGLAEAIRNFAGGVVLVSHDFRLIDQVAKDIWLCSGKSVKRWDGSIQEYKQKLAKKMGALTV